MGVVLSTLVELLTGSSVRSLAVSLAESLDETFKSYCEKHVHKKAEAVCITHKVFICMSCIIQNVHNKTDCNILDLQLIDGYLFWCFFIKQHLKKRDAIQCAETIESDMQTEIEDAYSESLEHLKECKAASYEVTRSEVTKLITRKKGLIAQQSHKLDAAIGYFLSGNLIEGKKIIREIMNGHYSSEITFQRKIPFSDTDGKSLVRVKELEFDDENVLWMTFLTCTCMSNVQDCQSDIGSVVDSDDSNEFVDDIAQSYVDENEPA